MSEYERYDVAIVGLGPVGQALALLLGRNGHRVLALDERDKPYPLPRAVHYDPDISRLLDGLGLADFMTEFSSATNTYEWQNADRATLLRFEFATEGTQGWPESTMFTQPAFEARLRRRIDDFPTIDVRRGVRVNSVIQDAASATLSTSQGEFSARFVIGCDGARSTVRESMNTTVTDLGFFSDWLICDLLPHDDRQWEPDNLQLCDPLRPTSAVNSGPGRRRFEFMRMPEDDPTTFGSPETAWTLMEPWGVTPATATLERQAVYTFQALWADRWRDGRLFLAGDAAHLMPPFYGQGMVSGMRDAANLAWKLDLVLRHKAQEALLDSYESERSAHVQHAIGMSVELGKVICLTEPDAVAARDAHFLAVGPNPANALPPVPPERLGPGAFAEPAGPLTGTFWVHGRVGYADGTADLLDRSTFGQFVLVADADLPIPLAPEFLAVVRVLPVNKSVSAGFVTDEDDRYLPALREARVRAVVLRPDFTVYATASTELDLVDVFEGMPARLHLN